MAAGFAKVLLAKQNTIPSACFKLFTSYDPEAILWLGYQQGRSDQGTLQSFLRSGLKPASAFLTP